MSIIIKSTSDIPSSEITPQADYLNRRQFIAQSSLILGGLWAGRDALAATSPYANAKKSAFSTKDKLNTLDEITNYNNFYEFGTDKADPAVNAKNFKTQGWTVTVSGEAEKTGTFNLDDFIKPYTLEERIYRLRCVEGWSMVIPWVGFPLADMIKQFKPTSRAKYVEFITLKDPERMPGQRRRVLDWPYTEGLRMDEAMNPLTLMAVGL